MDVYATLAHVKLQGEYEVTDTKDDIFLLDELRKASARLIRWTGYRWTPYYATRSFNALGDHIDDQLNLLTLREPLLVPIEVKIKDTVLVQDTDYSLWEAETPYLRLERLGAASWSSLIGTTPDGWKKAITVRGIWGWRSQYADEGWVSSADAVADALGINSSATQITVTDADGLDSLGFSPRFSPGQLIGIGSGTTREFMEVSSVDTTLNKITVRRGVNGSTAAAHALSDVIYSWQVEPYINRATSRWAGYASHRKGAYNNAQINYGAGRTDTFPADMPKEVQDILLEAMDSGWYAV